MADDTTSRPPDHVNGRNGLLTPVSRSQSSYETGESSRSGGHWEDTSMGAQSPTSAAGKSSPARAERLNQDGFPHGGSLRRKGRYNLAGGFLLHNSLSADKRLSSRGLVRNNSQPKGKSTQTSPPPQPSRSHNRQFLQPGDDSARVLRDKSPSPGSFPGRSDEFATRDVSQMSSDGPGRSSDEAADDADSTQIVQMALSLSESRRIMSRRSFSRATPPRLEPVPDGSLGNNLKQHLQHQRKLSYNYSPKFQQAHSSGLSSAKRGNSFQAGFDSRHDPHFRYQLSSSTLARAQKAKDHLELMAHYRRLLDVLPPLKPGLDRIVTSSPPGSPNVNRPFRFGPNDSLSVGRQYNPLQYIRNRKVRARERKVIDGEKQGFGDVDEVKPWIDSVVERATSFATNHDGYDTDLPRFAGAEEHEHQVSPDHNMRSATRGRRPRVDWFFEPCDIIADAYWLEQASHKELIEDRNWRKIFRPTANMSRPMSRETAIDPMDAIPHFSMQDENMLDQQISNLSKVDTDLSHSSARDRAKQRLHNIRAFPHRHPGPVHGIHHDILRHARDSASDISSSESDTNKGDQGTSRYRTTSVERDDALERRMLELVAREAREKDLSDTLSDQEMIGSSGGYQTPDRTALSLPPSRLHSRKGSSVDTSGSDRRPNKINLPIFASPPRYVTGRQSLDVPNASRKSSSDRENESSVPTSPELRAYQGNSEPASIDTNIALGLSRAASPNRTSTNKIRQSIRDQDYDASAVEQEGVRRDSAPEPGSSPQKNSIPDQSQFSRTRTLELEKLPSESSKTHRRTGSTRVWQDDQGVGLRGIFKGPRIDTVLRGGVSKISDILWRKDGPNEYPPDTETTDESESEKSRGRSNLSTSSSGRPSKRNADRQRQPKHFLDSMPHFSSVADRNRPEGADNRKGLPGATPQNGSLLLSRTDAQNARSSVSPSGVSQVKFAGSEGSEVGSSRHSSLRHGSRDTDRRPSLILDAPRTNSGGLRSPQGRHWSIADKESPTEQTRLTRREIARMRALVLSTGVKAMEINRRAAEAHKPFCPQSIAATGNSLGMPGENIKLVDVAKYCTEAARLQDHQIAYYELYILLGQSLSTTIQNNGRRWQASADQFTYRTSVQLQNRIGDVRSRIADDLVERSRRAADLADETNRDLTLGQPLNVNQVVDTIEKMLRRRRRRLRWLRRALWLMVEWLLVGFMWFVWFIVMILRVFLGVGRGVVNGVRWLLWL